MCSQVFVCQVGLPGGGSAEGFAYRGVCIQGDWLDPPGTIQIFLHKLFSFGLYLISIHISEMYME